MYTVIIADDEPWVAYGIANLIDWEALGFRIVDTALNGFSAMEKIKQHTPDLLVSDIRMPGLNGLELMDKIRDAGIKTEVVFMSGYTEFEYAREAIRLGAFDYLVKQVEADDLKAMLTRVAGKLAEKKAGDWDTYFRLFDESGYVSVHECAKILGVDHPVSACQFISLLFAAPIEKPLITQMREDSAFMLLFRTGTCKLGILVFGNDPAGMLQVIQKRYPNALSSGISDVSDGSGSFYLLYRQSDIAAGAARDHASQKALTYREAKQIMEEVHKKQRQQKGEKQYAGQTQAERIMNALDESFTQDIRITDLAKKLYISPNYLCTLVKRETGMTFSDYIISKRIGLAKRLLMESDLSIQEIVDQTGYRDYAHFNKLFKRREGITPSKYRNSDASHGQSFPNA